MPSFKFYKYKFYKFEDNYINSCNEEKLFGMKIDSQLSFASHVSSFCNKANQKLHAKSRVTNYMDPDIPRCFTISFVTWQYNYYSLVWMFHISKPNNSINSINHKSLRLAYRDNKAASKEVLSKDNFVTVYHKGLQLLAT